MKPNAKPKRIDPDSPAYQREANRLARDFCPRIHPCAKCSHPVVSGYCCTTCGDPDPSHA